jgi:cell division protein FtsQ
MSGIRPKRSTPLVNNQPLKPKYSPNRTLSLCVGLLVVLMLLLQQNYQTVGAYLNRSILVLRIENELHQLHQNEIGAMLSEYMGKGFFSFDVRGAKKKLEQNPWVAMAAVKRVWPDTLEIDLVEEVAIARWGEADLLSQYGEIFRAKNSQQSLPLPNLAGPDDSQFRVMAQYQLLNQVLVPAGLRMESLSLSARGSWSLMLNNGVKVNIGRVEAIDRVKRFIKFYNGEFRADTALIESVDLRYNNGFSVKRKADDINGIAIR